MSYIPKDAVTQSFRSNKGVLTPNQIIELDNENKFTKYGQLELIETVNASGVSSFDFSDLKDFNVHLITVSNATNDTSSKGLAFRLYESGTLESGSVYDTARQFAQTDGNGTENRSSSNSAIRFSSNTDVSSISASNINGYLYFYNLLDSTKVTSVSQHSAGYSNSDRGEFIYGCNVLPQASFVNKIQVLAFDTGTITGDISLYGIRFA
jgi:hypothetical protein